MLKFNQILLLISSFAFSSLPESYAFTTPEKAKFVSATKNTEVSIETLKAFTNGFGQHRISKLLKYGVRSYTVIYETKWKGKPIKASGLVLVPTGITGAAPLLSVQHGTIFSKDEAPTASEGYTGMELFASAGYIVVMPDYLGYGTSSQIFHPYYDEAYSAYAVIDMISSAKQFLEKEKVKFNDKLFLAGYSEGGYVTLAAAAEIEHNKTHDLKITAIVAGAGGYDLTHMLAGVTTNSHYAYPAYLAFVLISYNNTYDWKKPLTYFFKKQYADALAKHMGKSSGWTINSHLTTNSPLLFDTDFFARLKTPGGESELKEALKNNSIEGWKTSTPIRLYHGTKDEIIPLKNSESTLKSFHDAGSRHVTLTSIPGGTHGSSFYPMMEMFIPWFFELKD
jgi:pimeloyl-ACP methyl ester carboxylesterase